MKHFIIPAAVAMLVITAGESRAQDHAKMQNEKTDHIMVLPKDIVWKDGPGSVPPGAKMAVIEGDPTKAGLFTMRLLLPDNYEIKPHWHPADEHITVIAGVFQMGLGETFDKSKGHEIPVGGFAVMLTGTRHFAFTKVETIVQLHGMGPWGINYVNPSDDPRKKAQ